jgi:AcrR family transcriptional regulator
VPHSPLPSDSSWASPKTRISRPDAEQALILAVVELLDITPIPDITVHKIAEIAGVNFGYVNRYFETRLNLFATVTDTLADAAVV